MKNLILLLPFFFISIGCKKELPQPQHNLFLTFEKDGTEHIIEGTELSNRPAFGNYLRVLSNSPKTFILESWCTYRDSLIENNDSKFKVNITQFDTSSIISQSNLDTIFSEEVKDLNTSFFIRPNNPIYHSINIQYIESYPVYTSYSISKCDSLSQNSFEITSYEKLNAPDEFFKAIIEANFNITICSTEGNEVKLNNGKLKFLYRALN